MNGSNSGVGEYPGVWRGLVEDNNDPDQRKRYRVRVLNVHRDEVPVEALPWAEMGVFGGKGFGDIPHYDVGDAVFVLFERADRRFPVIVAGWLSYIGGTPDLPAEQTGDYPNQQRIWIRTDRFGNKFTMNPDEGWMELESNESRVRVHGDEGTVTIDTDVKVLVTSPTVQILEALNVTVESEKVFIGVKNEASLVCEDVVNIRAANTINIGRYEDEVSGALVPKLTGTVNVEATDLIKMVQTASNVLGLDVDVAGSANVDVIGNINIVGSAVINVTAENAANVTVNSGQLTVRADEILVESTDATSITVNSSKDLTVSTQAAAAITVGGNASLDVTGSLTANVTGSATLASSANVSVSASGTATVTATGVTRLESVSRIELSAPTIDISADSLLTLSGTATTSIDGGIILIG